MITSAGIRFTTDIETMRTFFELLGFETNLVSEKGPGWVSMRGDAGIMTLHAADHEKTEVFYDTDEPLENLHKRLQDAGFSDARIVDEVFGRRLDVTDPQGENVMIFERMKDTYGYRVVD